MLSDPHANRAAAESLPPLLFNTITGDGSDYRLIKTRPTIIRKLHEIARNRQQLRLHLFDDGEISGVFQSSIQRVDTAHDLVILHQLVPATWRKLISDEHPVTVSCYMPSGHLVFDTVISPMEAGPHNPFCLIKFPDVMHVQQLRSAYRVLLLPNTGSVELRIGRHLVTGKCLDLSLNGCCVLFPATLDELLKDMEPPKSGWIMRFYYEGTEVFQTNASISRKQGEVSGQVSVGLSYPQADAERSRRVQALLLTLQRDRIRQQPLLD
jgi:hypothetical protein